MASLVPVDVLNGIKDLSFSTSLFNRTDTKCICSGSYTVCLVAHLVVARLTTCID
jgi:hypothetical protein